MLNLSAYQKPSNTTWRSLDIYSPLMEPRAIEKQKIVQERNAADTSEYNFDKSLRLAVGRRPFVHQDKLDEQFDIAGIIGASVFPIFTKC